MNLIFDFFEYIYFFLASLNTSEYLLCRLLGYLLTAALCVVGGMLIGTIASAIADVLSLLKLIF